MGHAAEGSLQAYIDGEIDSGAVAPLSDHLAACSACAGELARLRRHSELVHGAFAVMDAAPPMLRAQAAIAGERVAAGRTRRLVAPLGFSSLAKAAMLLLALAGAGAAAIPGSPVRRVIEATFERVAQIFNGAPDPVALPTVQVPQPVPPADQPSERAWAAIPPADGNVRVVLHAPTGAVAVTVRLVDDDRANVETRVDEGDVRFVSGSGRLEVVGLGTGSVVIEIPRLLSSAAVEVNGLVHVYKQGERLRLSGPAGDGEGTEVRFDIGS